MANTNTGRAKKPSASDATGRKSAELQKQYAEELAEREQEIALATAAAEQEREDVVIDLNVHPQRMAATNTRQATDPAVEVDPSGYMHVEGRQEAVKTNDTEIIGFGPETPFDVPGSTPEFERERRIVDTDNEGFNASVREVAGRSAVQVGDKSQQLVEFRVNETLEDVTIGVGTNFSFEEGRRYRAPRYVRDHLEEKGYIYH